MAVIESASTEVLLEREDALAQLHEAFAATAAGRGRFVLVGGEAGVGKTSLVRRFCEELPDGTAVFWGGCDPLMTPRPLGPFLEIAERARGAIDGVLDPWSAAHDVAAGLLELCDDRQTLVVVVEDAHWADEGTLDVLRLLGRRNATTRCLALVTYRDDQLGRAHPLRIALGDLATAASVERLSVRPLSRDGVARLAGGGDVDVDTVWRLTSGNPFYVTELLAHGAHEVPGSVRDVVLARLAQLGPQATVVVEAAAIAPPSLDAALLLAVCGEAIDAVDECIASGVLHTDGDGVAFRHELSRAAVEESLSPARRLALHRSLLLALTDSPRADADLARIAHHAEGAADGEAVLRFAPAAAEQAARAGCVPRGCRPVRTRPPLRRRPCSRRPRGAPRGSLPGVLPRRRPDRGDRGHSRGDPGPADGGRTARGSASAHRAHRLPLVPRLQRRGGRGGRPRVTTRCGPSRATRARVRSSYAGPSGPLPR